jgi:hypothetical protein
MSRKRLCAWFRREDYDAVRALLADDSISGTFEQWLEQETERVREAEAAGVVVHKVIIDPQQFANYCRSIGQDCNFATLGAFTLVAARPQEKGRK